MGRRIVQPRIKKIIRPVVFALTTGLAATGLMVSDIKSSQAQFLPTSGVFYDFGNIFNGGGGDWLNPGALFGGSTLGDLISSTVSGGGLGGLVGGGVFDSVFDTVAGQLGIPDEIMGVIQGNSSIQDLLEPLLGPALESLGIEGLDGILGDIFGAAGIPDLEVLLDELYKDTEADNQSIFGIGSSGGDVLGTTPEHVTANVLPSLMRQVQALATLNEAVTNVGFSAEGQELTLARREAGTTTVGASEQIGVMSTALSAQQVEAATALDPLVKSQTSTQRTLKEAMTAMALLDAQATQLQAVANEQEALGLQIDNMALQVALEDRDGTFAIGTSMQYMNEQLFRDRQVKIAEDSSARIAMSRGLRSLRAMR